ncbi:hypothetical protein EHEL_010130 [Encephalitozoon hellem ATCC 50504]|uniref:Uncharacterized protein n=1 Tax=Encephalitozoon hellem TaxID=27973 RepID=A0A9Q9C4D6_ENCHE|nr:uncharacterized protein EHEL_010130 [Encephalitozoon hellem ATCC 50504]AFM97638.1 hypothetical protein EHEL_010130 [Encephalitozoon hellem ATCC 50504]UTX42327.1 hypothetical protein GPU96_01g00280 [Encephalitozoon hellem]WEL37769.1 hypothetical protein PFJ87_01g00210 [Encephalitozoon hellem]|eukprot:XP_003886619.1 hypothetical protein EHEL_010130 [Encephalitozoon hellem ATCC 50504]
MLPKEIDPYEFKFFIKDILPLSETYTLFRSSKLLKARETVKAISKTNQGLIVLIHKSRETMIYTPESKVSYFTKRRGRMAPKNAVVRFLKAKMVDFVVLRFKTFYCCLSRWDKDVCSFCIVACLGKKATERALLNPSEILGDVKEVPPLIGKGQFRFKDLDSFKHLGTEHKSQLLEANIGLAFGVTPSASDVKVNPIDFSQEDGLGYISKNSSDSTDRFVDKKDEGESCLIEIMSENTRDTTENIYSKPYKEVKNDEEGLIDYIISKITKLVCDDVNTGCLQEEDIEKERLWKTLEEEEESDVSSKNHGYDIEGRDFGKSLGEDRSKEDSVCSYEDQGEGSRYENIIRFGIIDDGKLKCMQKSVGLLSMAKFDRLEAFIIGIIDRLKETNINYVEVCSEIDFFIVNKEGTIHLYIRDLIHRKERKFMEKFSEIFEKLGART